jgi:ABC-type Co2+ transport system permease subunit
MERLKILHDFFAEFGIQIGTFFTGVFGAFVSNSRKSMTRWEKFTAILSGGFVANYVTPLFLSILNLSEEAGYGLAFIVGFMGMTAVEIVINYIHKKLER